MLTARILVTVVLNVAFAWAAFTVAARLRRRRSTGEAGRALSMFVLWWVGFGLDTILNTLTWLAGALGLANPWSVGVLTYSAVVCIVLMTWGLTYYLVYLVTGRAGAFWPLAAFYAMSLVLCLALIVFLHPIGVDMGPWAGEVAYANKPPPMAGLLLAIYFLVPPLGGAITYGIVGLRVKDRAQRYRILAVAFGIFVWFTAALMFAGVGASGDVAAIAGKLVAVGSMTLMVSAYLTPVWIARRLGLPEALPLVTQPIDPARLTRREQLRMRVRDLV